MPDPTLADFQRAFERVWERWPDAPRLPEGYWIYLDNDMPDYSVMYAPTYTSRCVGLPLALALCVVTAMEIGAWWMRRDFGNRSCHVYAGDTADAWWVAIWERGGIGDDRDGLDIRAVSLPSACLAALVAMAS